MLNTTRRRIYVLLAFTVAALALLFIYAPRLRRTQAQSGPAKIYIHAYATYQFNTLKNPTGLVRLPKAPSGSVLFIADSGRHVIRSFDPSTGQLSTVAGTLDTAGYTNGGTAKFNYPTGITGEPRLWGGQTGCNQYNQWGACTSPIISYANSYVLHINDSQNYVVRRLCTGNQNPNSGDCTGQMGVVTTVAGNHTKGYVDGSAQSASFAAMAGHTDSGGSCYMIDAENHCVRKGDGTGNVTTFAGTGYPGFVDGYRTSALFNVPGKMTTDASGNIYVADIGNNAIRKINTSGYVTTLAGGGPQRIGRDDGPGYSASFYRPTSVAFNPADSMIYVADSNNHCIRKIDANGNVTTYAGTGQPGLVNGSRLQAKFNGPTEVVILNGFMYVSDTMNNVIRRIDMATGAVTTYIS